MELIEFQWWRCSDGYRLVRSDKALEATSEHFERYRPLETPDLFAKFADSAHSAEGMLAFANQFGLVGGGRPDIPRTPNRPPKVEGIIVGELLRHHAQVSGARTLFERGKYAQLTNWWNARGAGLVRAELRTASDGRLSRVLVPPDLISAIWLQLAEYACSGARLFRCQHCNEPFTVGTGTGRRKTAMYCSNACKVAAFQARQRQEKR